MNKKLLSLAVAAAISAPVSALADATLYGKAHMSIDWFDIKGRSEYKGWTMNKGKIGKGNSRASRLGIKGSEDLGAGLKVIYQVEFGLPLANEKDYSISNGEHEYSGIKMRNTYVGLEGGFGTVLVGRHDTPLKMSTSTLELFNDTMADYEGTLGFDDIRADSTIAYITPSFNGFQFAAAAIPGSGSTHGEGGLLPNRDADSLAEGYSLAATYRNGPWYASAAYEVLSDQLDPNKPLVKARGFSNIKSDDYKKWRAGLGIQDLGGFYLSAIYENQESIRFKERVNGKDNNADLWQGQLGYAFGNNMIKGMYGAKNLDSEGDVKSWAVGFDHNFSKRTKAYALYTWVDADPECIDEEDWKGFSLGVMHKF